MKKILDFIYGILWSIFGNDDDPIPPPWYLTTWPEFVRYLGWYFVRNPLHNFCFYLIGMKRRQHLVHWNHVFNPNGGFNIIMPFISYYGKKYAFYIGWRPSQGVFGLKFIRHKKKHN